MLHPSYSDLMQLVNSEAEDGDRPIVNSRYSIVMATSRRARQLVDGLEPMVDDNCPKPLSYAVDELYKSKLHIVSKEDAEDILSKKRKEEAERLIEEYNAKKETEEDKKDKKEK